MKTFKEYLKESSVEVDDYHYQFSHSRKPKGHGSWVFTRGDITSKLDYSKHNKDEHYTVVNGSYGVAKKKAQAWAKSKGFNHIGVAP